MRRFRCGVYHMLDTSNHLLETRLCLVSNNGSVQSGICYGYSYKFLKFYYMTFVVSTLQLMDCAILYINIYIYILKLIILQWRGGGGGGVHIFIDLTLQISCFVTIYININIVSNLRQNAPLSNLVLKRFSAIPTSLNIGSIAL
mgnify:CR=1 FL=1